MHSPVIPPLPDFQQLSLAEQVAQMVVVRASGYLFDHQIRYPAWEPPAATLQRWVADLGVGGVILLGGSAAELGLRSQQIQTWARVPLLMAADIEEGVGQRFAGATWFPPPMAIAQIARQDPSAALDYAYQMGAVTAQEAIAIGLNWVLAPVVDVNNNPANPVINVRAFGDDPTVVSQLATAFIRGAHSYSVLTAAKHFPGHGDTAMDSHLELPVVTHDMARLRQVELPPFKAAIAAGVDAVMSAHLLFPALDKAQPATLSPAVLNQLLRQELGFNGLIVTDALVMGAIANSYGTGEAAVMAVEAGADVLLMPLDPEEAIQAVCAAVQSGRITAERIQASVERLAWAKQRVCAPQLDAGGSSHAWEVTPPPAIALERLAQPETRAIAAMILQSSMTVAAPRHLPAANAGCNIIVVDNSLTCEFLAPNAPAIAIPHQMGYQTLHLLDSHTPLTPPDQRPISVYQTQPTLLQLFVRGNPFRGYAGLSPALAQWLEALLTHSSSLQGVVVYGSPYMLDRIRPLLPESLPYGFTYGQMPQAQELMLNALAGRSPHPPAVSSR